jgi:hypothetical protein
MQRRYEQDAWMMPSLRTARNIIAGANRGDVRRARRDAECHEVGEVGAGERRVPQPRAARDEHA